MEWRKLNPKQPPMMEWRGIDLSGGNIQHWQKRSLRHLLSLLLTLFIALGIAFLLWQIVLIQRKSITNLQGEIQQLQTQISYSQQQINLNRGQSAPAQAVIHQQNLQTFLINIKQLKSQGILTMIQIDPETIRLWGEMHQSQFGQFEQELQQYYAYQLEQFESLEQGKILFSLSISQEK